MTSIDEFSLFFNGVTLGQNFPAGNDMGEPPHPQFHIHRTADWLTIERECGDPGSG
jgi:hypothetical protein